jgi:hypothetical protein
MRGFKSEKRHELNESSYFYRRRSFLAPATAGTTGTSTFRVLMEKESLFLSRTSGNKLVCFHEQISLFFIGRPVKLCKVNTS